MPSSDLATALPDGAVRLWLVDLGPHPAKTLALLRRSRLLHGPAASRLRGRPGPLPLLLGPATSAAAATALIEAGAALGAALETESFEDRTGSPLLGVDLDGLWDQPLDLYTEPRPSDQLIASVEHELGYRLPEAYTALARTLNGGLLRRDRFPTTEPTGWADDHVAVTGISAIGRTSSFALCGPLGSAFMQQEWGYPPIGIVFASTPTGAHQMLMLDYRGCGPEGEPGVVWVDADDDHREVPLAADFAGFLRGLRVRPPEPPDPGGLDDFEAL